MNTKLGYMALKVDKFRELSTPVAMRVIFILTQFISGASILSLRPQQLVYDCLRHPENKRRFTACGCVVDPTPWKEQGVITLTKQLPKRDCQKLTPIRIGETVSWDDRFEVTLNSLGKEEPQSQSPGSRREMGGQRVVDGTTAKTSDKKKQERAGEDRTFYIRNMLRPDEMQAKKGIRRVRSSVLPPPEMRSSLPVIVDDSQKKVVLVPHFQMIDRSAGVTCKIAYKPSKTLDDILKGKVANTKIAVSNENTIV